MTRRRKTLALLAALLAVAGIIFVVTPLRGTEVTLTFAGMAPNGEAMFRLKNCSSQTLSHSPATLETPFLDGGWAPMNDHRYVSGPPVRPATKTLEPGKSAVLTVSPYRKGAWRVRVRYTFVPGLWQRVRRPLEKAHLLKAHAWVLASVASAPITNAPPVP
jgi:hypothetical protein